LEEFKNIKITIEAHNEKATFEFHEDIDMGELIDKFALIATFLTFPYELIKEYLYAGQNEDTENTEGN
jgi:hypothetical protein